MSDDEQYMIEIDGSWHPAIKGDPGAERFVHEDRIAALEALLEELKAGREAVTRQCRKYHALRDQLAAALRKDWPVIFGAIERHVGFADNCDPYQAAIRINGIVANMEKDDE